MLSCKQHLHLRCLLDSGKPMTKFQIYKIQPNGLESYFPLDFRRYFFNFSTDDFVARCGAIGCTSYFSVIYHLMILDTAISIFPLRFILIKNDLYFNCRSSILG